MKQISPKKNRPIKARRISKLVKQEISKWASGKVTQIFRNSLNIRIHGSGEILNINWHKKFLPTRAISIDYQDFFNPHVKMSVKFSKSCVNFKDFMIDISGADIYDNRMHVTDSEFYKLSLKMSGVRKIMNNLGLFHLKSLFLQALIKDNGTFKGGGDFERRSFYRIRKFYDRSKQLLNSSRYTEFFSEMNTLKGFGNGNTPAGDDFFIGFYSSFIMMRHWVDWNTYGPIMKKENEKMSPVSRSTFDDIQKGYLPEILHQIFRMITHGTGNNIIDIFLQIREYGHTSGEDLLAGILFFLKNSNRFI